MSIIKILEPADNGKIFCGHCRGTGHIDSHGICQFRAEYKHWSGQILQRRCHTKSKNELDGVEYCGIHYNVMEKRKQV